MCEMILTDADLMDAAHWPVTVTFGLYGDSNPNCASVARGAGEGTGYSFNDAGISFWDELDEYDQAHEEPFDVECFVVHDSCRLTYGEFYHYMELACGRYAERFPEKAQELEDESCAIRSTVPLARSQRVVAGSRWPSPPVQQAAPWGNHDVFDDII